MGPSLDDTGLRTVDVTEPGGLTAPYAGTPQERPHAVRLAMAGLRRPDSADPWAWPDFGTDEVVVRPRWVHWVASAAGGATGLTARQSRQQRRRSRAALAVLTSLKSEVCDPVDEAVLAEWNVLYRAQVRRLRNGRNLAGLFRAGMLEADSGHLLVVWRDSGRIVCGCVLKHDPARSALIVRFHAVDANERGSELPRAMYAAAADMAAARGLDWLTAGTDPNLTGGMVSPGLTAQKLRLGFRPVPADLFGVASDDVAERVTSLDGLEPPVLRFEYRRPRTPDAVVEDFVSGPDALGLVSVSPGGPANEILRSLPEHRRLVL